MKVIFDPVYEPPERPNVIQNDGDVREGVLAVGPTGFIHYLSTRFGFSVEEEIGARRIERYRKALEDHLRENEDAFYATSFKTDPVSVAKALLKWRDRLKWAEWDFAITDEIPPRLLAMAEVEERTESLEGNVDHWITIKTFIANADQLPFEELHSTLPYSKLPPFFKNLLDLVQEKNVEVQYAEEAESVAKGEDSDLRRFQRFLIEREREQTEPELIEFQGDGSLLLLEGGTERDLAQFLTQLLKQDKNYSPLLIQGARGVDVLSEELGRNGLSPLGESLDTSGRPVPQLFFLSLQLLWDPLDPDRLMEFLTLPRAPISGALRKKLAQVLREKPGRGSERWQEEVEKHLANVESQKDKKQRNEEKKKIDIWLDHSLYEEKDGVPVSVLKERLDALRRWAKGVLDHKKQTSVQEGEEADDEGFELLISYVSALERTVQERGEQKIQRNTLERWADEVYQESPGKWDEARAKSLEWVPGPSAFLGSRDEVWWWNFVQEPEGRSARIDRTNEEERKYLEEKGSDPESPVQELEREEWVMKHGVFTATDRLVLVSPEKIQGKIMEPHPLMGDLMASSKSLNPLRVDKAGSVLGKTEEKVYEDHILPSTPYYWHIERKDLIKEREKESYSSLKDLFFYPYKWLLGHIAKVRSNELAEPPDLSTLKGNLAHRLAEWLYQGNELNDLEDQSIQEYVDQKLPELLKAEGCTLLLKGYRSQRSDFERQVKDALKTLTHVVRKGEWKVAGLEEPFEGEFQEIPVQAYVDLLLTKKDGQTSFIDLKWSIKNFFKELDKEEELQLALYADILKQNGYGRGSVPAAYFLLNKSQLISRYSDAFKDTVYRKGAYDEEDQEIMVKILERMKNTYELRIREMQEEGKVEVGDGLEKSGLNSIEEMDGERLLAIPKGDPVSSKAKAGFNPYKNLLEIH